ncbi:LysM peptidoglycan-binding domain-containing protein [Tumebacillus permanentifrigoris]|uniref:3D (Asp-Asp-Asp) domain-containing protein n=1 Tax=Tumebacillus permanentifrigoris TaxID=378543 RepID=A0A316D7L0_9BACL|nr:LysM peptidoglycan-binding domain-containing protein [Tumebacillus permanentifrigoris]PWK11289.1 3D (Asp-Asp-Asp) domain-containing protein [Tumebacillus permanentifrigoris]
MMMKKWKHLLAGALMVAGALTLADTKATAASITVQPGQTLSQLAKVNGTTVEAVKYTNNLNSNVILAGQQLTLPFPYKVGSGDYMSYLAKRYNTTVTDILSVNHLDRTNLFIGEVIMIPVGKNGVTIPPVKAVETAPAPGAGKASVPAPVHATAPAPAHAPIKTTVPVLTPIPQAQPAVPTVAGLPYTKTVDVAATAYGPGNINWQWGGYTRIGTKVRAGVISVDPNVIPLGTKVWVTGYNSPLLPAGGFVAVAEDTGGAIKGNRVDLYIEANQQQLVQFGKQNIQLYILK